MVEPRPEVEDVPLQADASAMARGAHRAEDHVSTPRPRAQRADRFVLAASLVTCAVLCLWGLGDRSIWLDEALSWATPGQLLEALDREAGTMGIYAVVLTGWTAVVGDSVTAIRIPSVLFLLGAVAVFSRLALRVLPRSEALLATMFVAASPGLVRYGQEARSYAMVALAAVASWLCLARALEESATSGPDDEGGRSRASRWWFAFTVLSVVGTSAHGLYLLQLVAQAGSLLLVPGLRREVRRLIPAALINGIMLIWQVAAGVEAIASWIPPLHRAQVQRAGTVLLGPVGPIAVLTLVVAGFGAVTTLSRRAEGSLDQWRRVVPVVWAFVPVALLGAMSLVRPYFVGRYVIASVMGLSMLVAAGTVDLDRRARRRLGRGGRGAAGIGPATLAVAALLVVGQVVLHAGGGEESDDWRTAARIVAEGASPGDGAVFTLPDLKLAFDAEWVALGTTPTPPTVVYPDQALGQARRFEPPMDPDRVAEAIVDHERVWVLHRTMYGGGDLALQGTGDVIERAGFRTVEHHRLDGGVQVLLLERSGA